jgi:hypothetical protein
MTRWAQLLLVLTCLAPICFVQAAVEAGGRRFYPAFLFLGTVVLLVALCLFLLSGVRRYAAPVPKKVSDPAAKESEPLAFFVSYALPLIAGKDGSPATLVGLGAFALIMGMVLWQLQVFHVNPLLALFGYKFFGARSDGMPVLVLTRNRTLAGGDLSVIRMSETLWLLCDGGESGPAAGPSEEQGSP